MDTQNVNKPETDKNSEQIKRPEQQKERGQFGEKDKSKTEQTEKNAV